MSNDASNAARLRNEHIKAISQSAQEEEKWRTVKKEYDDLKETLLSLPKKVEHKIMVPVGSVGLFPGKLIHTNEITVLLGDNWFVQRSAHQAAEIVSRRLELVNQRLDEANSEKEFMESRKKLTEELIHLDGEAESDGIKEIHETIPGSNTKGKRRTAHKSSHNIISRPVKKFDDAELNKDETEPTTLTDSSAVDDLFARLDELEIQEQNDDELLNERKTDDTKTESRVRFEGDVAVEKELESSQENCIRFNHTNNVHGVVDIDSSPRKGNIATSHENSNGDTQEAFKTPADIYKLFAMPADPEEKPLKSILKKERKFSNEGLKPRPILKHSPEHKAEIPTGDDVTSVDERKPILKSGPEAITANVVERKVDVAAPDVNEALPKKPVSRFKASRQKK